MLLQPVTMSAIYPNTTEKHAGQLPCDIHLSCTFYAVAMQNKHNHSCYKDLTNDNGDKKKKKYAISSVFYSKSMVFILPGALVVYQGYTIFYYGKFVQLWDYTFTLLHD